MDPRKKKVLGSTGLEVTRLGLGCASLGWLEGDTAQEQANAVVGKALSLGVNILDTAPKYGTGKSEQRLGKALQEVPRDSYVLASKVGRLLHTPEELEGMPADQQERRGIYFDFSYDGVMRSLEESLERLGLDRIDVLHIHDPDRHYDEAIGGAYTALDKLRSDGVIKGVSAGMNQWQMLAQFAQEGEFDCFLMAGRYSLLEQGALDELLPLCIEKNIGIVAGGTYNSGLLAKVGEGDATYNYRKPPPEIEEKARALNEAADRHGVDLKAAASQFVLAHPAITCIIPGTRFPERVEENFRVIEDEIPADFWADLKEEELIRREAPVPGD
ncbi:MAG: aldo/keto reductase [Gemmatimonadetes bacterium]|jgi:D-threo-aldose 1-dehydrogenase|nr:aldo/keto reductase [Gemmatimonadota bacterium]